MMKIKFITPIKLFIQSKRCCVCVYGVCPFCRSFMGPSGLGSTWSLLDICIVWTTKDLTEQNKFQCHQSENQPVRAHRH